MPRRNRKKPPVKGASSRRQRDVSAAVVVRIARQAMLDAMPGILHRFLGLLPGQARFALRAFPALLEARLGVGVPVARPRQTARLGAVAIGGAVILVLEVLAVVRRLVVLLAEVAGGLLVGARGAVGAAPA